ncbi:MAG: hypothetical protein KC619_20665 [Myxococcales bacterium]|nr:hypothetical protein [Myxococcales bacterium]
MRSVTWLLALVLAGCGSSDGAVTGAVTEESPAAPSPDTADGPSDLGLAGLGRTGPPAVEQEPLDPARLAALVSSEDGCRPVAEHAREIHGPGYDRRAVIPLLCGDRLRVLVVHGDETRVLEDHAANQGAVSAVVGVEYRYLDARKAEPDLVIAAETRAPSAEEPSTVVDFWRGTPDGFTTDAAARAALTDESRGDLQALVLAMRRHYRAGR